MRGLRLLAVGSLSLLLLKCGATGVPPTPVLSITPRPKTIHDQGQVSKLSTRVVDDKQNSRSGSVTVTAQAGEFQTGGQSTQVALDSAGNGEVGFVCERAKDPACTGAVRLEARWEDGEDFLVQVFRIEVVPYDAGVPDAGSPDGGP